MPMELISSKLCRTAYDPRLKVGGHIAHWCPACNELHEFAVDRPFYNGAQWTFSGTCTEPTFTPSMNIRIGPRPINSKTPGQIDVCHYFVKAGKIEYLGDCTHIFKGQTIDLPDLPADVLKQIAFSQKYAKSQTSETPDTPFQQARLDDD